MKALRNSVQLIGNLGKDVEIITFDNGGKKANVSLATTNYYKTDKGETKSTTQWHNLVAWGKNAEFMNKILKKGSRVAIHGSLSYRTYEDKSGNKRSVTEILVSEFANMSSEAKQEALAPTPF